ncbi:hypothetical protein ACKI1I_15225 [Streptomyces turgidiscabies]|uniref:Uncharacterized protein n=1 Tax=Streptomyces turgidiscabies (strain Car8) TaxID=698760 RepID=L7F2K2_STRT8|nr:hypothetical protein [Streptomyces turgidiscabies]ELP65522.1 hypothetical protein STRTUCAR8_06396 [Streptomyces turgidiscabies Car8]GAQ70530.1 hypothetical protein T45_02265 [Streptomyces turgidiscabies]
MTDTPRIHDIVKDIDTNKIGRVMDFVGRCVQLRPIGGGREWDARPERLEPTDLSDALSVDVAEANVRSRRGAAAAANTVVLAGSKDLLTSMQAPRPSAEVDQAQRSGYENLPNACSESGRS